MASSRLARLGPRGGSKEVLIVTDGAVDLPPVLELSAGCVSCPAKSGSETQPFNGDRAEFWRTLRQGTFPSTTPPTVNAIAEAYRHHDLVLASTYRRN